jgi:DNA-binding transcriptional MerR regulator
MKECMNIYSIRDLENLSGIKAHTIRIWEKRYGILSPGRTYSNIRSYNESELKKILNIAYLNSHGYKISSIAGFSDDELSRQVVTLSSQDDPDNDFQPGKILMSAIRFDERNSASCNNRPGPGKGIYIFP